MSTQILSGKIAARTAPEKGSFPLDHEGVCKKLMSRYMVCLGENRYDNSKCREESKEYLVCRMNNELMAREELEELGFADNSTENKN